MNGRKYISLIFRTSRIHERLLMYVYQCYHTVFYVNAYHITDVEVGTGVENYVVLNCFRKSITSASIGQNPIFLLLLCFVSS